MHSIDIDTNNAYLITRLMYYLWNNYRSDIEQQCSEFMLDAVIQCRNADTMIMFPCQLLTIVHEDHPIQIEYSRARTPTNANVMVVRFERFRVSSEYNLEHLISFMSMINKTLIPDREENQLSKFIWDHDDCRWGHFQILSQRKLDTIYLNEKQQIVDRIHSFLNDSSKQELYTSLDIPNKQVFLLYGLPGSGKTSLIRALASHFKYNLAIVKNIQKADDQGLERMMIKFPERTFLVFEDIDCMFDQREVHKQTGITYSGLLNLLDGLNYYDKLIVFVTTNFIQQLDSAFRRRIDMFVEFGYVRKEQILNMYTKFFSSDLSVAESFYTKIKGKKLTVNMLEKYFVYCLHKDQNPLDCIQVLEEYSEKTSDKNVNLYL